MSLRTHAPLLIPAGLACLLLVLHLTRDDPQVRQAARDGHAAVARKVDPMAGAARDAELREEWRAARMPSVLDTGGDRAEKELYLRMKTLGTSPVEIVEEELGDSGGLTVGVTATDLDAFLAAGGHYSGPVNRRRQRTDKPAQTETQEPARQGEHR